MRKWKNVNKKHPNKSGKYIVFLNGIIITLEYSKKYRLFNYSDCFNEKYIDKLALYPTHWANLPKPPKYKQIANKGDL